MGQGCFERPMRLRQGPKSGVGARANAWEVSTEGCGLRLFGGDDGEPLVGSVVASEEAVKKSLETMLSCITIFCLLKNRQTVGSRRFAGVTQVVAVEIHLVFEIEAPGNLLDRE